MIHMSKKKVRIYKGYDITKIFLFDCLRHETKTFYLVSEGVRVFDKFETLHDAIYFINTSLRGL